MVVPAVALRNGDGGAGCCGCNVGGGGKALLVTMLLVTPKVAGGDGVVSDVGGRRK